MPPGLRAERAEQYGEGCSSRAGHLPFETSGRNLNPTGDGFFPALPC
jgi:hypothetical protein